MLTEPISLHHLELFQLNLPQKSIFQSGIGTRKSKETLIVKWVDEDGVMGYGECSCRPDPYYSAEFIGASKKLIEQFIAPHLKNVNSFGDVKKLFQKIRGWNFTKTAFESAIFQIIQQKNPDFHWSNYLRTEEIKQIPVGISLGIYHDYETMKSTVEEAIAEGYHRIKFKIAPTVRTDFFEKINPLLFGSKVNVSFDANGSYRMKDLEKLGYFIQTYQTKIEQPTPPDRFDILLKAKELYPNLQICFDEEVKNLGDVIKLHSIGFLDELNLKVGRVGGLSNSIEIINYCHNHQIPCWIGGMFETGIGRLQNLEMAAFLPNAIAHDLSPSSRYFKEDIISPAIEMQNGFIDKNQAMCSKVNEELLKKYTTFSQVF